MKEMMSMTNCKKIEAKEETVKDEDNYSKNRNELEELTKTHLMRAFVEAQDPSSKVLNIHNYISYLLNYIYNYYTNFYLMFYL